MQRRLAYSDKMKEGPISSRQVIESDTVQYSNAELEFITAIDKYKRKHRRPFPCYHEILHVLLSLGYRKMSATITDSPTTSDL